MKQTKVLTLAGMILMYSTGFSQTAAVGMSQEFKQISSEAGNRMSSTEAIQTYSSNNVKGSQFFYADWVKGTITTVNNQVIAANYLLLFDKVRQMLFIKDAGNAESKDADVLVADPDKVLSFTLNTDKPYTFMKASVYDSGLYGKYFEVLSQNTNYTLLKSIETSFEKADMSDMMKVKNGDFSDEFVDHITYYIYHNQALQKVNFQEYSIRKALKDQKARVNDYFNEHSMDEVNENFLIGLINSLNS